MYVVTPEKMAGRFPQDLAKIFEKHGFASKTGASVPDTQGRSFSVVRGLGFWNLLWSTNVPLGGHENPSLCGSYKGVHPDPGQFSIWIEPGDEKAHQLLSAISGDLKVMGYEVRSKPILCSSLSRKNQ
jgi:hypothetical protein